MVFRVAPGSYKIACGSNLTSDEAADGIFVDDAQVVCINTEYVPPCSVVYTYFVDYVSTT